MFFFNFLVLCYIKNNFYSNNKYLICEFCVYKMYIFQLIMTRYIILYYLYRKNSLFYKKTIVITLYIYNLYVYLCDYSVFILFIVGS